MALTPKIASQRHVAIPFPEDVIGPGVIYRSPLPSLMELPNWVDTLKVQVVVQLCLDKEFADYGKETVLPGYEKYRFHVIKFPIPDYGTPSSEESTWKLLDEILQATQQGKNVVIHCVGGNGRTGLILALLAKRIFSFDGVRAVEWVRQFVPWAVETFQQESYIENFCDYGEWASPLISDSGLDESARSGTQDANDSPQRAFWNCCICALI